MARINPLTAVKVDTMRYMRAQIETLARVGKKRRCLWRELDINQTAPEAPCCYVIYSDGRVVYVGSTENLRLRLCRHFIKNPAWRLGGRVKVRVPRRFGEWLMTERRLIDRLKPIGNTRGVNRRRNALD